MFSHEWFAAWAQWFWPAFANHFWQTTLIALLAWVAMALLKRAPARARYAVWLLVFAKLLLPSALLLWVAQFGIGLLVRLLPESELPTASFTLVFESAQPLGEFAAPFATSEFGESLTPTSHNEFFCLLTGAWLLGAGLLLAGWSYRRNRFAQTLHTSQPITGGREFECLQRLRERLSCRRKVGLWRAPRVAEPGVWRVWHPVIVLPEGMAERLNDAELEAVLLHELLHIRHWDNLLATAQIWVCCLCWFHPLVWWLDRRLLAEREWVCDEAVLRWQGAPQVYAASLWKVAQFGLGWPLPGVSRASGSNLKRRIEAMLQNEFPTRLAWPQRLLIGFTVTALLVFSYVIALPPRNQTLAQGPALSASGNMITDGGPQDGIRNGVTGGVTNGVKPGVAGGVAAGVKGGVATGIAGGVEGGVSGAKVVQKSQDNIKSAQPQIRGSLEQWPEYSMQIDNTNGAPLFVTQASVKFVRDEVNDDKWDAKIGNWVSAFNSEFRVLLNNQSDRSVSGIGLEFDIPPSGLRYSVSGKSETIAPRASLLLGKGSRFHYPANRGLSPTEIKVRVYKVEFLDGSVWEEKSAHGRFMIVQQTESKLAQDEEKIYEGKADLRPVITYRENANYTKEARDNKVEGNIVLSAVFRRNGKVTDIRVLRGLPHGLTEQAIATVERIRFEPAMKDGQPVSVRGNLEFSFQLL